MNSAQNCSCLVLIRHAQSQWNLENRFTGWADPALTEDGVIEAIHAGDLLRIRGFAFDRVYTSVLQRSIDTAEIILRQMNLRHLRPYHDWRLNERHYGVLQGSNKAIVAERFGYSQVLRWRRGYFDNADALELSDARHPIHDRRYQYIDPAMLPAVENLEQTGKRIMAFWRQCVDPDLKNNRRILISSHGNALRALLKELTHMSVAEVESFEIPTAVPIKLTFDSNSMLEGWEYLSFISDQEQHVN